MVFLLYGSFALPMPARSDISDLLQVCQGVVYTSVEEFQNNFLKVIHEVRSDLMSTVDFVTGRWLVLLVGSQCEKGCRYLWDDK